MYPLVDRGGPRLPSHLELGGRSQDMAWLVSRVSTAASVIGVGQEGSLALDHRTPFSGSHRYTSFTNYFHGVCHWLKF